jgi:hypothetical protein
LPKLTIQGAIASYQTLYSKDERGALLPISRGQCLIVVHSGGCAGFVPGALVVWKATWFCEKLLENISVNANLRCHIV